MREHLLYNSDKIQENKEAILKVAPYPYTKFYSFAEKNGILGLDGDGYCNINELVDREGKRSYSDANYTFIREYIDDIIDATTEELNAAFFARNVYTYAHQLSETAFEARWLISTNTNTYIVKKWFSESTPLDLSSGVIIDKVKLFPFHLGFVADVKHSHTGMSKVEYTVTIFLSLGKKYTIDDYTGVVEKVT